MLVVAEQRGKPIDPHVDARRLHHFVVVWVESDAAGVEDSPDVVVVEAYGRGLLSPWSGLGSTAAFEDQRYKSKENQT